MRIYTEAVVLGYHAHVHGHLDAAIVVVIKRLALVGLQVLELFFIHLFLGKLKVWLFRLGCMWLKCVNQESWH